MASLSDQRPTVARRLASGGYWTVGGSYFSLWLAMVFARSPLRTSLASWSGPLIALAVLVALAGIASAGAALLLWRRDRQPGVALQASAAAALGLVLIISALEWPWD